MGDKLQYLRSVNRPKGFVTFVIVLGCLVLFHHQMILNVPKHGIRQVTGLGNSSVTLSVRNGSRSPTRLSPTEEPFITPKPIRLPAKFPTFKEYKARINAICEKEQSKNSKTQSLCDCFPNEASLYVRVNISRVLMYTWHDVERVIEAQSTGHTRLDGGHWRPETCAPRRKVAIIVPFRDRYQHLRAFLAHTLPIWLRQQVEFKVFLVEQNLPYIFNKAAVMNSAFLEMRRVYDPDCLLFHDVDLIMESGMGMLACQDDPTHLAQFLDREKYILSYGTMFGGAVLIKPETFKKVNGYSNTYFGWGGEDDDMSKRMSTFQFHIYRPNPEVSRYSSIRHKRDFGNPYVPGNVKGFRRSTKAQYLNDGVLGKNLDYKVVSTRNYTLFTHIVVDILKPVLQTSDAKTITVSTSESNYDVISGTCQERDTWDRVIPQLRQSNHSTINDTMCSCSKTTCQFMCSSRAKCLGIEIKRLVTLEMYCILLFEGCNHVSDTSSEIYVKKGSNLIKKKSTNKWEKWVPAFLNNNKTSQ